MTVRPAGYTASKIEDEYFVFLFPPKIVNVILKYNKTSRKKGGC